MRGQVGVLAGAWRLLGPAHPSRCVDHQLSDMRLAIGMAERERPGLKSSSQHGCPSRRCVTDVAPDGRVTLDDDSLRLRTDLPD
ncbi:hypothetical protein D3C81_1889390 [compost metagenome]